MKEGDKMERGRKKGGRKGGGLTRFEFATKFNGFMLETLGGEK